LHRTIAIEIQGAATRSVEEADTLQMTAQAIDASGEVVADAAIVWDVIDTAPIGFTLDSLTGLIHAVAPDTAKIQARVDNLTTGTITIRVLGASDSISPGSDSLVTLTKARTTDSVSAYVWDLTTNPGTQLALTEKPVHFELSDPAPGSVPANSLYLALVGESGPGDDPFRVTAISGPGGRARVVLHRVSGTTQPDSAVIHAIAITARGDTVPGSPVRLVVLIEN
jgi:hypothetical protein